ncbi:unnamed protein product, partial [Fusarium langsethiae]
LLLDKGAEIEAKDKYAAARYWRGNRGER